MHPLYCIFSPAVENKPGVKKVQKFMAQSEAHTKREVAKWMK
jgi:hypothetical protein